MWFKIFGRIPEEDYLEFSRINFQEVWLNQERGSTKYAQSKFQRTVIRCHSIGGTSLQLSCGTTCFKSSNETIRSQLLVLKVVIFISDKVERYDGQKKHQRRLRLYTTISVVCAILESWVTMPEILAESDRVPVFMKCFTGHILGAQILDIVRL